MKSLIVSLVVVTSLYSCQKMDNSNEMNDSVHSIEKFLGNQNGFRITELIEEGTNKTLAFSPYLFKFYDNGAVTATKSNETINGSYAVFKDDNKTELRIIFPMSSQLYELSDDWYFDSQADNIIRFEDNGDVVQFQKQ